MTDQILEIEITEFDLIAADFLSNEAKCKVGPKPHESHRLLDLPVCTEAGVAYVRGKCINQSGVSCAAIATWMENLIVTKVVCPGCGVPTAECWSVRWL